ncbi:chaperone protein ClpC4, chloroplastic-like [Cornus florida]|uniref:chaperone protein ClpC4, chloroplastic-like n=1 Tax=Cornus florida TaxID=4283 RepID=UPI002897317D|nr:chaperone protein ClpC4, chloroplastic-like [Cornus florida]
MMVSGLIKHPIIHRTHGVSPFSMYQAKFEYKNPRVVVTWRSSMPNFLILPLICGRPSQNHHTLSVNFVCRRVIHLMVSNEFLYLALLIQLKVFIFIFIFNIYLLSSVVNFVQCVDDEDSELLKYGTDLTKLAKKGELDPVIGRESQIQRCLQILCRRTKNNPVLVGSAGVGKTAIAEGYAPFLLLSMYLLLLFFFLLKILNSEFTKVRKFALLCTID